MKIIPKKDLRNVSLPISIYSVFHIADAINKDGEEFDVHVGLDKEHVLQLHELSLDESDIELQRNTGDRNRFGLGSYKEWYEKKRTPFCLIHKRTNSLAALVWFGPKDLGIKSIKFGKENENRSVLNKGWHTISCRSYPGYRRTGLMSNFTKFVMEIYKEKFPNIRFWGGVDARNKGIVKLMSNLGFSVDEVNSDLAENWLVMIK
jgi:RimJ/RimL family protein N-acetyltransferase